MSPPTSSQDDAASSAARTARTRFAWLNVIGGVAVLGSYVVGLATHPESRGAVWGGVPESLQPLYTVCMFLAAGGYFLFTPYVFFTLDPGRVRVFGRFGFGAFSFLYAAILIPSALWMPLTFRMVAEPDASLWLAIRIVLLVVGLASVALIVALQTARPEGSKLRKVAALVGAAAFSFQTAVLDALVWPVYFPY